MLATRYLARVHEFRGDFTRAIDLFRHNLTALSGDLAHEYFGAPVLSSVASGTHLVACLVEVGEFAEATAVADGVDRIAEEGGRPLEQGHSGFAGGLLHLHQGDFERAIAVLQRGFDIVRQWNISAWLSLIGSLLGLALARAGRVGEALPLQEQGVQQSARGSMDPIRLGEGYALAGRLADARDAAHRALLLAREWPQHGHEAWGAWLLGEIAAHPERLDAELAEAHYSEALALAEPRGMRPLVAHCHLGLGKLFRRTGRRDEAREHLTTATTMYREMDMCFWLEKSEAEMRGVAP